MKSGSLNSCLIPSNSLFLRIFLVILFVFMSAVLSSANTHTWVPAAGGAWTTPTNWSPTGLPVAGDDIIINSDQSANITSVPNLAVNSLSVSGNCTLVGTGGGTTLTIGGAAGTDLTISLGKTLTIGTNLSITLANNATSTVNGTLTINAGRTFNTNGTGVITTVIGTLMAIGNVTCTDATRLIFQNGSAYNHAMNGGTVPTATWADGSTCLITGVVATSPAAVSLGQSFFNLTWNNPGQTWNPTTGAITAGADYKIRGTFTFANSGTGSNVWPSVNCTVANYLHTGGIDRLSYTNPRTHAIGNFTVTGGTVDFTQSTGTPVINISGNVSITGGTLTVSGAGGSANINFVGPGVQTFTSGGTISGPLYWNILSGSTVDFGTNILSGGAASTFILSSGGTIITANVNGLALTGATGTIQTGGTRTYNIAANYQYNGAAAQATGNGLTSAANLTINNSAGLTLSGNVSVSGNLNLTNGIIATGANTLSMGLYSAVSGADLGNYVFGNLLWNIGTGAQIKTFDIGDATRYTPVTIVLNNVTTAGTLTGSTKGVAHPDLATSPISNTKYIRRYYTFANNGLVFSTANVTLTWRLSDIVGFADYTKFIVGLYNAGWSSPTFSSRTSSSIQATNLTSFGDLVTGESSCAAPVITGAPVSQSITYGANANFTVTVAGTGLLYKWQEDAGSGFVNITDGGIYSNSSTNSLKLTKPVVASSGYRYRCVITGTCGSPPSSVTSGAVILTIIRKDLNVSGLTVSNKVYDSNTTAFLEGTASVTPLGTDVVTISGTATGSFADKNVGTGKTVSVSGLSLSGTDAGNYTLILTGLTADITLADFTVTGLIAYDKVYDGNITAILGGTPIVTAIGSDIVNIDGTAVGSFADKNVGTGKEITVTGLTLSGTDSGNYNLIQQTGLTANITKADLTVTGLTALNKVYDTGISATLTGTAVLTAFGTDVVEVGGTPVGSFADKNAGTGKTVLITGLNISGTDADNYNLVQGPLTADITARILTASADNIDKMYGSQNPPLTISYSGFAGSENASVITIPFISTTAVTESSAGTYPIILSGGSAVNYILSLVNGVLTINKASQIITFNDIPTGLRITENYNLEVSSSSGLAVVLVSSDPNIASISGNTMTVTGEGTVTITASQPGDDNWDPAADVTKTIVTLPSFDNINSLFTPNNDGINDFWYIPDLEQYGTLKVTVYNRFGQAVYKSDSYKNDWDGTWNGHPLPSASYYYIMKSSVKGVIKGVVNIIR